MKRLLLATAVALLLGSGSAMASAHSDYTTSFPLQTLKTFEFKDQRRILRDPLANNAIWASENVLDRFYKDVRQNGHAS